MTPSPLTAEYALAMWENGLAQPTEALMGLIARLKAERDELEAETTAARAIIDALWSAGIGNGLSYYACAAARLKVEDFYRRHGWPKTTPDEEE